MAPGRVGRAKKPHDYARCLRGSLTALPCAGSELARIHSGHRAGFSESTSPPRNGIQVNCTQRCCVVRRFAAGAVDVAFDSTALSCRRLLDGSAACGPRDGSRGFGCGTGCAFSRTRPVAAYPCGAAARATREGRIFGPRFSARRKSLSSDLIRGWGARRQASETLCKPGVSQQARSGGPQPGKKLDQFGDYQTERRSGNRIRPSPGGTLRTKRE